MFWFLLQVDPIQSYLNLKIGLPPVLKAGSSHRKNMFPQDKITVRSFTIAQDLTVFAQCKLSYKMTKDSVRLNKSHDKHRILLCRYWASLVSIFPTGTVTDENGKGGRVGRFTLILIGISRLNFITISAFTNFYIHVMDRRKANQKAKRS